jgi:glycosyltransferase involved in cell wall biosynthesis
MSISTSKHPEIIFYRDFQGYTGGHQKVRDYFDHLFVSSQFVPVIAFSNSSIWNDTNPWFDLRSEIVSYEPGNYDYGFVAGTDWQVYLPLRPKDQPVINLIQHVRHADPSSPLFEYLSEPAIRICVSQQVADAINATGRVNGPVIVIENGLAIPEIPAQVKKHQLLIFGPKNAAMAAELSAELQLLELGVHCVERWLPRDELLKLLAASRIALMLPSATEGFYLPALEAMHYCDIAIVPDCVGNRSFCRDRENCLLPEYNKPALLQAVLDAGLILNDPSTLAAIKTNAKATLKYHSLAREQREFLAVMQRVETLWASHFCR